ncbi:MAG: putative rane protein [Myxococcales bacterium]|jgi:putative membrane protein|nr:putative rane protein [Myxococcales bacterium]
MTSHGRLCLVACGVAGALQLGVVARASAGTGSDTNVNVPPPIHPVSPGPGAASGDPTWIAVKIHHVNKMEIELGNYELKNGQSPKVKNFAAKIVRDHETADRQLAAYAKKAKIELEGSPTGNADKRDNAASSEDAEDVQMHSDVEHVKSLKGAELDKAFASTMMTGHDKVIEMVRVAQGTVADAQLKGLLDQMLPTLVRHRRMAATLVTATSGTSSAD